MKKLIFSLLTLFSVYGVMFSQQDPSKALGKAGRALSSYNLDPASNKAKLNEAIELIKIAANSPETNGLFKTWSTRGEIYDALASQDFNRLIIDSEHQPQHPESAMEALNSFIKALELAAKKYETKEALEGIKSAGSKVNIFSNSYIKAQEYDKAYASLDRVFSSNKLLLENGKDPLIPEPEIDNHLFVMAYCAQLAGMKDSAKKHYSELYDKGSNEPSVYAQYFNLLNDEGDEKALEVLTKGRQLFPDNTEILFAEINYYIRLEKFDVLEEKLKDAIEREPNNASVYSALGNVYMNLFQHEFEANGESAQAQEYFGSAKKYFDGALGINSKQFDALYSIGSMYYNKAVILVKQANELPLNETEKYNKLVARSTELMDGALPYFKRAEALDPNDINTLVALKEIFARRNDFELVKEFSDRLENVHNNIPNDQPYFKE